jgi:hypothetical protein
VRVIAVDWSGKLKGSSEHIWLAEAHAGTLVSLENGRTREELVRHLIAIAERDPQIVVGLDFAFSFPRWWCETKGWNSARDIWTAMQNDGEHLLEQCESPFWGRPGRQNPHAIDQRYRRTEREAEGTAKSVFQIGGAGAVGTGSIRGMRTLAVLAHNGFTVWRFAPVGWPRVVEIYPRALTGPVKKNRWAERHAFLTQRFAGQPPTLLERAAGSEDAFDAAVSALVMAQHEDELRMLVPTSDSDFAIEGQIWRPE